MEFITHIYYTSIAYRFLNVCGMLIENSINVFVDGSSRPHPRRGGIGIRLVLVDSSGHVDIDDISRSGFIGATNNQMELLACIEGIKEAMQHPNFDIYSRVDIHTDSLYVIDNLDSALYKWPQNKWCNIYNRPVDNAKLWKELTRKIKACMAHRKWIEFHWVKGHRKCEHNKAADRLAKQSANNAVNLPLEHVRIRRKLYKLTVERGCIPMNSQRISIRIVTGKYLLPQKVNKLYCSPLRQVSD